MCEEALSYDYQIWAKSFWFWESGDICVTGKLRKFGVLWNKNNDCVISSLRGVFLHDKVLSAC